MNVHDADLMTTGRSEPAYSHAARRWMIVGETVAVLLFLEVSLGVSQSLEPLAHRLWSDGLQHGPAAPFVDPIVVQNDPPAGNHTRQKRVDALLDTLVAAGINVQQTDGLPRIGLDRVLKETFGNMNAVRVKSAFLVQEAPDLRNVRLRPREFLKRIVEPHLAGPS